jgi:arylsulfatase A-like enzyme
MDPHGPYVSADESWSKDFQYPPYLLGADQPLTVSPSNFGLGVLPKYQQIPAHDRPSQYVRRYDGEIRFTDAQIGRLLAAIDARGDRADTLIVLSADHGESLTEHRELFQHGWFVYDTTIKVPLLLSWPGVLPAGRVVDTQVSGVDLVPTLDELLDLETPETGGLPLFDGQSFARLLFGPEPESAAALRVAFSVGARENHPFAVRAGRWKMIHTPAGRPPVPIQHFPREGFDTPERFELYNLASDPTEVTNLAPNQPQMLDLMKERLARFRQTFRTTGRNW